MKPRDRANHFAEKVLPSNPSNIVENHYSEVQNAMFVNDIERKVSSESSSSTEGAMCCRVYTQWKKKKKKKE